MAVVLRFAPAGMTSAKYDEIVRKLDQAGAGTPAGRLYHVCFGDPNKLRVSDIWDSKDSFQEFGNTLRPILEEVGVDSGEPEVLEIYNIIEGARTSAAQG